jgi:hypothetical protein
MSGGVLCGGGSRGNVVPRFFSHRTSSLRISSSSSNSGNTTSHSNLIIFFPLLASFILHFTIVAEHVSFVKDVAVIQPPQHLSQLLSILKTRGTIIQIISSF